MNFKFWHKLLVHIFVRTSDTVLCAIVVSCIDTLVRRPTSVQLFWQRPTSDNFRGEKMAFILSGFAHSSAAWWARELTTSYILKQSVYLVWASGVKVFIKCCLSKDWCVKASVGKLSVFLPFVFETNSQINVSLLVRAEKCLASKENCKWPQFS